MKLIYGTWFSILVSNVLSANTPGKQQIQNLPVILPIVNCSSLVFVNISTAVGSLTRITSATQVQDPISPYCDVKGYVAIAIQFEVRLPLKKWTQRFVQSGCGGLCGNVNVAPIENSETSPPSKNGELVLSSTDMGHSGMDDTFGSRDYQLRVDFAYRGVHVTTLVTKALIKAFYGQPPKYSYFVGCSDGGREALMEAQRFPDDFNGIVAGAAAMNFITLNTFYHGWNGQVNLDANGKTIFAANKLGVLHQGALNACDAADGVQDSIINVPWACQFDPSVLKCAQNSNNTSQCLTAEEIRIAREIYYGAHDSNGTKLTISGPLYGSELIWNGVAIPSNSDSTSMGVTHALPVIENMAYLANVSSNYTIKDFKFTVANFNRTTILHPLYDATDINLNSFYNRSGKLIMWHGLEDTDISSMNSVAYFTAVQNYMGKARAQKFLRLYLLPGVAHCGGGNGPSKFDWLNAILQWVEQGVAPQRIVVGRVVSRNQTLGPNPMMGFPGGAMMGSPGGTMPGGPGAARAPAPATPTASGPVDQTRPLYPYPFTAKYSGSGSTDDEKNFVKSKAMPVPSSNLHWQGESFFSANYEEWCAGKGTQLICSMNASQM